MTINRFARPARALILVSRSFRLALVLLVLGLASRAGAQTFFTATFSGASEVPSNASTATGYGYFELNAAQTQLTYSITFSGLTSAETGAHFHNAAAGLNGAIVKTLAAGSPKAGVWTTADVTNPLTSALVTELLAGRLYVDIHSTTFSNGEIRGQVTPVPAARVIPELESNETKAQATCTSNLAQGDAIVGASTGAATTPGANSIDYFLLDAARMSPGIYRHRLSLQSATPGHTLRIRGLTQTQGVISTTSDAIFSSATIDPITQERVVQWYDNGSRGRIYISVAGIPTSTADYRITHDVSVVTPVDAGLQSQGPFTFSEAAATTYDFDYWVYDSNVNPLPGWGHDEPDIPGMMRTLAPGAYFIAVGRYNVANDQASPADDTARSGMVLDFPAVAACASTAATGSGTLRVNGPDHITDVPLPTTEAFEVKWVRLTVVPGCSSGDFNGDGDVGTDLDIQAFFRVLGGGPC